MASVTGNKSSPSLVQSGDGCIGVEVEFVVPLDRGSGGFAARWLFDQWRFRCSRAEGTAAPSSIHRREMEVVCYRWSTLGSSGGIVGVLVVLWRGIWKRRRIYQVRSSFKISSLVGERLMWRSLNLDGVFQAGWETACLLLLRRRRWRSSGGRSVVVVGVECVLGSCFWLFRVCSCVYACSLII